ncbi:MAG: FAD-dependent oxidoreductase, partial [Phycisphaerales bacterium]
MQGRMLRGGRISGACKSAGGSKSRDTDFSDPANTCIDRSGSCYSWLSSSGRFIGVRMAGSKVIVIGGGLAGLASAVELSTLGAQVTLIERNQHLGGKMNVLTEETAKGRFTFDMGPAIITLPQVLRGIVRRSGRKV